MFLTIEWCPFELFEIEMFICIKIDLVLNTLQGLIPIKPKKTIKWKQHPTNQQLCGHFSLISKPSKTDELDMLDTAGEVRSNS